MSARPRSPAARALPPGGRSVPVPWARADRLHAALGRRGYPCTLCLDPLDRVARLEPWPGVDPAAALAALGELLSPPAPPAQGAGDDGRVNDRLTRTTSRDVRE